MRITISGTPGSGKSTVGRLLAKKYKLKYYSMGDLRGKMANAQGITIDELNMLGEKEFFTDKKVDEFQKELGKNEDNFVVDGRLSFYFIPDSIKIYLDVNLDIGSQRIFLDPRDDEGSYKSIEEVKEAVKKRMKSDKVRYLKYYNLNPFKKDLYDIYLDTSVLRPEQIVEIIAERIK